MKSFFPIILMLFSHALANGQLLEELKPIHSGQITQSFVEPIQKSVVASAASGVIEEALVKEGDEVSSGDKLATIRHKVLLAEKKISQARSESTEKIEAAKAKLNIHKQRMETLESLRNSGHVNQFELEEKRSEYEQALAEFRAVEREKEFSKLNVERIDAKIDDHVVRSPIDGVITEIHRQPGEFVSPNQPQFATVMRLDELKVRFYLDEKTLSQLGVGTRVQLEVGLDRRPVEGTVYFVSPIIDADSFTGRIFVRIENKDMKIRSGTVCFWHSIIERISGIEKSSRR